MAQTNSGTMYVWAVMIFLAQMAERKKEEERQLASTRPARLRRR